jgi:hypothetical protein
MRFGVYAAFLFVVAIMPAASVNADTKPSRRMDFQVQEASLGEVMEILTRYAKTEGVIVENIGPNMPQKDNRPVFYVNLTRRDSVRILVTNFLKQDQMFLAFYYPTQAAHPEKISAALISELRQKWPDIHVYTGP